MIRELSGVLEMTGVMVTWVCVCVCVCVCVSKLIELYIYLFLIWLSFTELDKAVVRVITLASCL